MAVQWLAVAIQWLYIDICVWLDECCVVWFQVCVITGGEMLRTVWSSLLNGELLELMERWEDEPTNVPPSELVPISDLDGTWSDTEERHGAWEPVALYAMIEQVLRTKGGTGLDWTGLNWTTVYQSH